MSTQTYFELSQGEGNKMFTLWRVTWGQGFQNRRFVKNLSTDRDKAISEGERLANKAGSVLLDEAQESLKDIVRGPDVIRFGRYRDKKISQVDNNYLLWLCKKGPVKESENGIEYTKYLVTDDNFVSLCIQEALTRGIYTEYKGQYYTPTYAEILRQRDELNSKSEWVSQPGTKVTLHNVKLESVKFFESFYGPTCLNSLRTSEGHILNYFGKDLRGDLLREEIVDVLTGISLNLTKPLLFEVGVKDGKVHTTWFPVQYSDKLNKLLEENKSFIEDFNINCSGIVVDKNITKILHYIEYQDIEPQYQFELGHEFVLEATIKEHTTYNDIKQTVIQRPKLFKLT